jgi:FkbM family methyltransferase
MFVRRSAVAAVGRRYPLYSGNFQLVNSRIGRAVAKAEDGLAWCPSPGGDLIVPLSDEVGRCIFFTGDYDKKLTWLCQKLVRPGDIAFDIGANLGLVTLTLARAVGPSGQVHAFEPNPILQELIQKSIDRNSASNVTIHRMALGSSDGELTLFVPSHNSGQGSFKYHSNAPHCRNYRCIVKQLSQVVRQWHIDKIRLMKIDVEGFENEVLLGAVDVLREIRPDAIILETNEQHQPAFRYRSAIKTLLQFDYRFLGIPKALFSMSIVPIDENTVGNPSHDVIAVPKEKFSELERIGLL